MKILLVILFASLTVFSQSPSPTPILLADRVGINTPAPLVPLHISVTHTAEETASSELIRFTAPNGHDDFKWYLRSTHFGDDVTNSVGWGFFPNAGGVQGSPGFGWIMEDMFGLGDDSQWELHIQVAPTEGVADRPLTIRSNRKTGDTVFVTSATSHFYSGHMNSTNSNEFHVAPEGVMSIGRTAPIVNIGTSVFQTLDNGGADNKHVSIRPFPTDSATSWLLFGNVGGGVSLARFGQGLAFYRGGSNLNAGESHAYRYYAYGPEYGGQPLLAVSDGFKLAAGRAIYFSTSSDPEGASDVQMTRSGAGSLLVSNPTTGARTVLDASFNANTFGGGGYKVNGVQGVTVSGSSCVITQITSGIVTGAVCQP